MVLLCLCGVEGVLRLLDCKKSLQIRFREATVHGSLVPDSWRSRNEQKRCEEAHLAAIASEAVQVSVIAIVLCKSIVASRSL